MDGSLPGYHFHRGFGSGANNWLVNLEGGGWCNNLRTCLYRKKSRHDSSYYMEKEIPFTGIMSDKPEENPNFFNWNRVKVRYCDGALFTGEGYDRHKFFFASGKAANLSGTGLVKSVGGGMSDEKSCSDVVRDSVMNQAKMGSSDARVCALKVIPDIRTVVPGLDLPLPLDASVTIFVDGPPGDCTEREVAYIFHPFLGYEVTRLVTTECQNVRCICGISLMGKHVNWKLKHVLH